MTPAGPHRDTLGLFTLAGRAALAAGLARTWFRCRVTGSVGTVEGEPLAGATVDVWHSDRDGYYDAQQLDEPQGLNVET